MARTSANFAYRMGQSCPPRKKAVSLATVQFRNQKICYLFKRTIKKLNNFDQENKFKKRNDCLNFKEKQAILADFYRDVEP